MGNDGGKAGRKKGEMSALQWRRAIEADCKAGNMVQHDYFHENGDYLAGIEISWMAEWANNGSTGSGTRGDHVIIYADCANVRAFLDSLQ